MIPGTVARQVLLSMGLSGQEYWSGLPFLPPGHLPDPGVEPTSPALAGRLFTTEPHGEAHVCHMVLNVKEKSKAHLEGIWTVDEGLQF